ncbi:MAG: hypothetical protein HY898_22005 [Deltaproteobacteria bacterium]|nr:hypothetical protein [Deltaproteobacteria bacterium]
MIRRTARTLGAAAAAVALAGPAAAQDPVAPPAPAGDAEESTAPTEPAPTPKPKEKAEPKQEPEEHREPSKAGIDFVLGFGKLGGGDALKFTSYSLLFGGDVRLGNFAAGLRLPVTSATTETVAPPTNKQSQTALGNVELAGTLFFHPVKHLELPVELALVLPTAGGDPAGDEVKQRLWLVQQTAAASRGFEDNALFMPKHMGVVPRVGIDYEHKGLALGVYEKFEFLFKAGALNSDTVEAKGVAVATITGVNASYEVLRRHLSVGLRAWAVYEIAEPYKSKVSAVEESKFQMVFEPQIAGRIGPVVPLIGFLLPAGGRLGDPGMKAVRIMAAVEF